MGLVEVQKKRMFDEVSRAFFATGEKPRLIDITTELSRYFAKYPIGTPLSVDISELMKEGLTSNVDRFNELISKFAYNLDILYEASQSQVDDILTLSTLLRTQLSRLKAKRINVINKLDDYLFTLYNTDGYYYSISDSFATLDLTDLSLTGAFIDTNAGKAQLPTISSLSTRVLPSDLSGSIFKAFINGKETAVTSVTPVSQAFDGLTNTAWITEVVVSSPQEIVMTLAVNLNTTSNLTTVSRIDFEPFGMTPVQAFIEVQKQTDSTSSDLIDFGKAIKSSAYTMSFIDDEVSVRTIVFNLRKTEPDYVLQNNGVTTYKYIFGAKEITISKQVYDAEATFVSDSLFLDPILVQDNVIDAVSLVVEDEKPTGTDIVYYVAADVQTTISPALSDFDWKRIVPLGTNLTRSPNTVINFNGARTFVRFIRANPGPSDIQLIAPDNTNKDLLKRNPSPSIVDGVDMWRICSFKETDVIPSSVTLDEGINSTKVLYKTLVVDTYKDLANWKDYINGTKTTNILYGRIDTGNGFFYGGDLGESGKSVYLETYLDSLTDQPVALKEVIKSDPNSKTWNVKVFLNGREVADMPIGIDKLIIPFKFQQGSNHIAVTIDIPAPTTAIPNPYLGTLDLMGDADLNDFGDVKLASWNYVDIFKIQHNEVDQPFTFTIYNDELVSRRVPTTNFRVKYSKPTDKAPTAVRLRADFSRAANNPNVTSSLDKYRLRFLYGSE